ncbi:hypothetical protein BYT27DRAFT_7203333 [Phlegmacium glaucopus]|nr:hypothetical protein BYT27DRAFT_7203333 [Phlegmacium glaucopus]
MGTSVCPLAPEFYDNIPSYPSLSMVIVNFIRDKDVGMFEWAKKLVNNGSAGHADLLGGLWRFYRSPRWR